MSLGAQVRVAEGDGDIFRPRFEAVFDAHHADVLAFARRRVDGGAAADDVVAETFAVAWRRRDVVPEPALPWLYGVARRVIANHRRSEQRRERLDERLALQPGKDSADPAALVGGRERVLGAFARLSEPQREVLRLVAWDGLDTRGAARVLGCSAAAFRVRLHRARRELKRQLDTSQDATELKETK